MPAAIDPVVAVLGAVTAALAVAVVALVAQVRALARRVAGGGDPRVLDRLASVERDVGAARSRLEHLAGHVERLSDQTASCLQRVGLVRYDAFQELGGHLSFSLALQDARGDGVVLSVLNDREGARAYAKPLAGGRSTFALSEEEHRAIAGA
ncbi:MAG: DUF4446 family protein [Armatimonadota bacterium]|nr:DUF4446 family protein [Armatimonadota bacterium]MDR7453289.1 DUF4446 family protein [Armatimonadota bacterium]MDR7457407.1 DUF4446 family protein [Armatimonadota bacterium]